MARIQKAHFPPQANAVAVFGLPLFSYLLLRSYIAHREGHVLWKGREYGGRTSVAACVEEPAFRPAIGQRKESGL
jgi:hypothetical protein